MGLEAKGLQRLALRARCAEIDWRGFRFRLRSLSIAEVRDACDAMLAGRLG